MNHREKKLFHKNKSFYFFYKKNMDTTENVPPQVEDWQDTMKKELQQAEKNTEQQSTKLWGHIKHWYQNDDIKSRGITLVSVFVLSFALLFIINPPFTQDKSNGKRKTKNIVVISLVFATLTVLLPLGIPVGKKLFLFLQ